MSFIGVPDAPSGATNDSVPPAYICHSNGRNLGYHGVHRPIWAGGNAGTNGTGRCRENLPGYQQAIFLRWSSYITSDARTQLTGPKLSENTIVMRKIMAIPALCAAVFTPLGESAGKDAVIAARMANNATSDAQPNRRGLRRPTLSMNSVMKLFLFD